VLPLTIAVSIEARLLREEVENCFRDLPVRIVFDEPDHQALLAAIEKLHPDVVLLDISRLAAPLEEMVRAVKAVSESSMVIVLHTSAEPEKILAALRAGAHEYIFPPLQANLRAALERKSAEGVQTRSGVRGKGKTVAFLSVKGGCGATTLACHVAVELGRHSTQHVLLADLDLSAGMISFLMRSQSPYTVLDAVQNLHRLDLNYWKALCSNGYPGLEVISAPPLSCLQAPPEPEQLRHVLSFARSNYEWTVVDLGRALSPVAMIAFEEIDEVYLVSTMDMPALHAATQVTRALAGSNYGRNRIRLILNRTPSQPDTTPQELEKVLGHPIFAMLPDDYAALCDSYCERRMLMPGSNLGRSLARLAHKIAGTPEEKNKRRFSFFGTRN
jgi:pilus assembly protein CpaE